MDDFTPRKHKRQRTIDGFVPQAGYHGRKGHGNANDVKRYQNPLRQNNPISGRARLDNFGGTDGFTASMQSKISRPGAYSSLTELTQPFERKSEDYKSTRLGNEDKFKNTYTEDSKRRNKLLFWRKKDKPKVKISKRQKRLRIAMVAGSFLILVGGGMALRAYLLGKNIFKGGGNSVVLNNENVDPTHLSGEGDGRVNILILGKGGPEQNDGPELTDTIILASIDPLAKEAVLLGIPRDLWVKSPSGSSSKINEVYANAMYSALDDFSYSERQSDDAHEKAHNSGVSAIKDTISENMGVPIHYYTMVDFAGFRRAIDTVGGININVPEDLIDATMAWENRGNATLAKAGWQQFDGKKALMYARSRKGTSGTDFGRSERQRQVILALKDKALSTGTIANPLKINQLISDFSGQVFTDFSVNEILRIYELSKEIPGDRVGSVGLEDYVMGQTINGLSAQVPKAGVNDFSDIQNYVRNIMRDAFLRKENAKVMVLNGTSTTGLATKTSNELKSFGYNVYQVDDAPTSDYTSTVLVDLRGGKNKYTLNYLEKRLNIKAVSDLPDPNIITGEADFVIIIGSTAGSSAGRQ